MSQQIVCDSTPNFVLLKNYEDMEARNNTNAKLSIPINAFLAVPGQKYTKSQNDNINSNERSRESLDDDNMTTL